MDRYKQVCAFVNKHFTNSAKLNFQILFITEEGKIVNISPKTHSTDALTVLIDLLNTACCGVKFWFLKDSVVEGEVDMKDPINA